MPASGSTPCTTAATSTAVTGGVPSDSLASCQVMAVISPPVTSTSSTMG